MQRRVLTRNGHPVPLQPKTFELLLLMVRSPGRAFSKEELMKALWPDTFASETNLANLVVEIRSALGDDAHASRVVRTVPRFGYAFTGMCRRYCATKSVPTLVT